MGDSDFRVAAACQQCAQQTLSISPLLSPLPHSAARKTTCGARAVTDRPQEGAVSPPQVAATGRDAASGDSDGDRAPAAAALRDVPNLAPVDVNQHKGTTDDTTDDKHAAQADGTHNR